MEGRPLFDLDKVRLGMQNNQLSSLLCAVLEHAGGSVTLTQEEATRVHEGRELQMVDHPDGRLTLSLKGDTPH